MPQLPPGYRWIAVRPGAAPARRRPRRPLGPTPRYAMIPRWGLVDPALSSPVASAPTRTIGPSSWAVRATLTTTIVVLAAAALLHVVRYVLLIVNRGTLLHPVVAWSATWLGVLASVGAFISVIGCAAVLSGWLIARRAAAFDHRGQPDPRSRLALRAGCLIPFVNVVWAPVFVIELADAEDRFARLRNTIAVWWVVWALSTAVSVFASATAFTQTAQGIADNTESFVVAYLLAAAAAATAAKVVSAFERTPVERPVRRWLIVPVEAADEPPTDSESEAESAVTVEPERQEPAA